jgi:histidinol phosphatase-like enzyme
MVNVSASVAETTGLMYRQSLEPQGRYAWMAKELKAYTNLKIAHAAFIASLEAANKVMLENNLDMVGLGRAQFADPHLIRKTVESKEDEINKCAWDHSCLFSFANNSDTQVFCLANPKYRNKQKSLKNVAKGSINKSLIEGIFIDFDGVISKNSLDVTLEYVTDYINEFTPIPVSFIKNYYRTVNSFPLFDALYLLFGSLGLTNKVNGLLENIKEIKEYKNESITVEEGFYHLVDFCKKNSIQYKILTMASLKKIQLFLANTPIENICCLNKRAKADCDTYSYIRKDYNINLNNWLLIDDDPLTLRTAALCGIKTILMKNSFFDELYNSDFGKYFYEVVECFDDVINIIKVLIA